MTIISNFFNFPAHPNLRLFITHGGLLSLTETSSAGVPLIVIPIFGDQYNNAAAVVERGQGVRLDYANFTADSLSWAIGEILSNPRYASDNMIIFVIHFKLNDFCIPLYCNPFNNNPSTEVGDSDTNIGHF